MSRISSARPVSGHPVGNTLPPLPPAAKPAAQGGPPVIQASSAGESIMQMKEIRVPDLDPRIRGGRRPCGFFGGSPMVTIEHYARVVASVYDAAVSRDWAPALTAIH